MPQIPRCRLNLREGRQTRNQRARIRRARQTLAPWVTLGSAALGLGDFAPRLHPRV
jgi:hypothetical protein